jgi:2-polyprenyl-3-methyl-5-hydroxy-6-metoxy-1,4-benzoquinol methylase
MNVPHHQPRRPPRGHPDHCPPTSRVVRSAPWDEDVIGRRHASLTTWICPMHQWLAVQQPSRAGMEKPNMTCVLCGGDQLRTISQRDAKSSEYLNVSVCDKCALVQQVPIPSDEDLQEYYSHTYRTEYKKTYTPKPRHIYRAGKAAIDRLEFLSSNSINSGHLLDVGAGGGEFVYLANKKGFVSSGVEPNTGYSEFAKKEYGINISTGQLADISDHYSVVTMFHVLEHMPSPMLTFKKLWSIIEPGGSLFVEVPNIEAKDASPHNVFFKAHIYYFGNVTLAACASQYFDVVTMDYAPNLRMLFRRRDSEASISLPDQVGVEHILKRLEQKGWLEYVFLGGGVFKLFSGVGKLLTEARVKNQSGTEILAQLMKNR